MNMIREACINDPLLLAILVSSNIIIWLSYVSISGTIAWTISKVPKVPFPAIWWLFASFILSCSATHFCAFLVFFRPAYYLESVVMSITAIVSLVTAILLLNWRKVIVASLIDAYKLKQNLASMNTPDPCIDTSATPTLPTIENS